MKKTVLSIMLLCCFSSTAPAEKAAAEETGAETLLFMEVPVVVTASRKEQPITEAPAAVTVVTAEDIRQSGYLTIPDVLRSVSGVHVMTLSARDQQVGIRGINAPFNNKVLVLIDGRSVYLDINGNVLWSLFPIGMEEIERIEVIKSPISTLYGANAFSGVVNIITKTAQQLEGTEVHLTGGSRETYVGSLIHAGALNKLRYKLSAGFDRTDEWGTSDRAGDVVRLNLSLGYQIGPEHSIALSGGTTHTDDTKAFLTETVGSAKVAGDFDYLQLNYRFEQFKVRAYLKTEDFDGLLLRQRDQTEWDSASYDVDAQYAFDAGTSHSLLVGADFRLNKIQKNTHIPDDHSQELWAAFIEDEFRITDTLRLIAGVRYDHHPLVEDHFSPRGTVLYTPAKDHMLRFSVAKAYRNPSLVDSYINLAQQTTISLPPDVPSTFVQQGNERIKSEGVTSFETGYQGTFAERATLGVNVYYNDYSDLFIYPNEVTFYAPGELFPGSPGGLIPKRTVAMAQNGGGAWGVGGELDLNVLVYDWLSLLTNYSWQQITDKEDNPTTLTLNEKGRVRREVPQNMVNAGARMRFKNGISANLLLHWVDGTTRLISDPAGNEYQASVRPYTTVDGRVGYSFLEGKAEVSLALFNIFNDRHYEYPPGINLPDQSSERVGTQGVLKLSGRF